MYFFTAQLQDAAVVTYSTLYLTIASLASSSVDSGATAPHWPEEKRGKTALRRLGDLPPDPPQQPLHDEFLATALLAST